MSIGFYTLMHREIVRVIRIWPQTLIPQIINMTLYLVIFGKLIGARIGTINGIEYLQYILPGLLVIAIFNNAYNNLAWSFFGARFAHHIEELFVSPMTNTSIMSGYIAAGIIRSILVAAIVLIIANCFASIHVANLWLMIFTTILIATIFALAGLLNAIFASKFEDITSVPMCIITPLTYFAGVFYSIDQLPTSLKIISFANPIFYLVNLLRFSMLGISDVDFGYALYMSLGLTLALFLLAWYCIKHGYASCDAIYN